MGGNLGRRLFTGALFLAAFFAAVSASPAQTPAPRLALVIGEATYKTGPLASAANDAGLIADTLQLAGFDVTGAADLNQDELRKALREFIDKASAAGPNAVVFVYLAGRALQYEGENYFAPVDAVIPRASNAPLEAVRLSDYLQPLAQTPLKARIIVIDGARINAFAPERDASGRRPGAGRAGQWRALRLQRRAGLGRSERDRPLWRLRPVAGGNAARGRPARGRRLRAHAAEGVGADQGRARALGRVEAGAGPDAVRPRAGRAAADRGAGDPSQPAGAPDPRLSGRPGLCRGAGAGHARLLYGFPQRLSQFALCGARPRHAGAAPRGGDLAARLAGQHAQFLLELSATLSARAARRRRAPAARHAERRPCPAAALRSLRIRRAAAGRAGRLLFQPPLCRVRRRRFRRSAADGLSAAAAPDAGRTRAAAGAPSGPAAAGRRGAIALRPARGAPGPVPRARRGAGAAARRQRVLRRSQPGRAGAARRQPRAGDGSAADGDALAASRRSRRPAIAARQSAGARAASRTGAARGASGSAAACRGAACRGASRRAASGRAEKARAAAPCATAAC